MTQDTEDVVALSETKFQSLSDRVDVLEGLVNLAWQLGPRVAQLVDSIRQEWSQSGDWTEWDQQVRDEITAMLRAIDESRAALHQEGIAP